MTLDVPNPAAPGSLTLHRRTLLGLGLAAGVLIPFLGAGTARADSGGETAPATEEYEMPEGIGSEPWWD